jgi:hypothetical protein
VRNIVRVSRRKTHTRKTTVTYQSQREEAWAIRAYPCTGLGVFLIPMIPKSPAYSTIKRLQGGNFLMDIGCFVGHDPQRLIADEAPSDRLYGVDIVNYWM